MEKEYGCAKTMDSITNVVSREFLKNDSELFEVFKRPVEVLHSEGKTVEKASDVILGAELRIGNHVYTSTCVVVSCRYDVLFRNALGFCQIPKIEYSKRIAKV